MKNKCIGIIFHTNIPLRDLFYISRLYQQIIREKDLYSQTQLQIPTPQFVVFYNGTKEQPERRVMRLSDLFAVPIGEPNLELQVVQLNINMGYNEDIKQCCRTLGEYTQFIDRVRKWNKVMELKDAVEKAVNECIREGILAEFLTENRKEVLGMSLTEWNQELFLEASFEDGEKVGRVEGRAEGEKIGEERGEVRAKEELILTMLRKNQSPEAISELTDLPLSYVEEVAKRQ